jgi:hypothetical protein
VQDRADVGLLATANTGTINTTRHMRTIVRMCRSVPE